MLPSGSPEEDDWTPAVGDYVEISGTEDEWEGVIGVLEEHHPATEETKEEWTVFVPLEKSDIRARRMVGVNFLTGYVRFMLRGNEGRVRIPTINLERADPAEF